MVLLPEILCGMLGTVAWSLAETRAAGQPPSPGAYPPGPWGELEIQELDTQLFRTDTEWLRHVNRCMDTYICTPRYTHAC